MRRALTLLVVSVLACLGHGGSPADAVAPPGAAAAAPPAAHQVNGRLYNPWGDAPVPAGLTVKLRKVTGSHVGAVVDTDRTNAKGRFVLHAGPTGKYVVQVKRGSGFLGGYVGGSPRAAASTKASAERVAPAALGKIWTDPSFIQGTAVDTDTLAPVAQVTVTVFEIDHTTVIGTDVTGADGKFRINGVPCREFCWLFLYGADAGHQTGWRTCNAHVVPDPAAACGSEIGRVGRVYLDAVESP
jgi:hypothetical protein